MSIRAALRKTSLIDFPGRVASVLFFPGCNLRCPYCQNGALVLAAGQEQGSAPDAPADDGTLPLDEALAVIDARRNRVSGVVVSGGEPLVHAEMPEIASRLRAMGLAVKLDTNGTFPERIEQIHPDYLAIDIKTSPASYSRLGGAADCLSGVNAGQKLVESVKLARSLGCDYEFRITCAPGIINDSDIEGIVSILEAGDKVYLQAFRPGGCLDPSFDSVDAYSTKWMHAFRDQIAAVAPQVKIRGE